MTPNPAPPPALIDCMAVHGDMTDDFARGVLDALVEFEPQALRSWLLAIEAGKPRHLDRTLAAEAAKPLPDDCEWDGGGIRSYRGAEDVWLGAEDAARWLRIAAHLWKRGE